MQPAPTTAEWAWIIGIDGLVVLGAVFIAYWCWQHGHVVSAFVLSLPLLLPPVWGLWQMLGRMDDAACSPDAWFCFGPVGYHWGFFVVGWLVTGALLTVAGFVIAIASTVGPAAKKAAAAIANERAAH